MPSCLRAFTPRAFTLIEILVVIVIIGILIAAIGVVGVKVLSAQKVKMTETIMHSVKAAIDQFKDEDPLAMIYDRMNARTFGPFPPYQLAGAGTSDPGPNVLWGIIEPVGSLSGSYVLTNRLHRDMVNRQGDYQNYVQINDANDPQNNDIRALYAYLKLYVPDAISGLPKGSLKPLTGSPEYVDPEGGLASGTSTAVDVLGIYDAWGVPLDYFLYVKLEWTMPPTGGPTQWVVTERVPVLRSLGISYEEYQAETAGTDALDPQKWIFSDPFPSPPAQLATADPNDGTLKPPANWTGAPVGWVRAKAGWGTGQEDYPYVPVP